MLEPLHIPTAGGFLDLRDEAAFWNDNTDALVALLRTKAHRKMILTRPPRFGKTIFCKMLGTYVDCQTPDDVFARCFDGTAIARAAVESDAATRTALANYRQKCAWLELVRSGLLEK